MPVQWFVLMVCAGGAAWAQQAAAGNAQDLYYQQPIGQRGIVRPASPLGIRYNLLSVDPSGRAPSTPVAPDFVWKTGQCAAVRLEANRGGYLYVLAQGSSGDWQPLLPSPQAVGEPHFLNPYSPASIPRDHCFEIMPPAGKERLFIVVSERKEDMADLERAIGKPQLVAGALDAQVDKLRGELRGRDLKVQKVAGAASSKQPANSVFVVAGDSRANDRLIVEIEISHQ